MQVWTLTHVTAASLWKWATYFCFLSPAVNTCMLHVTLRRAGTFLLELQWFKKAERTCLWQQVGFERVNSELNSRTFLTGLSNAYICLSVFSLSLSLKVSLFPARMWCLCQLACSRVRRRTWFPSALRAFMSSFSLLFYGVVLLITSSG